MLRIRKDSVDLEGILSAAVDKCKPFGIDVDYGFMKKHRRRNPPKLFDDNKHSSSAPLFNQYYTTQNKENENLDRNLDFWTSYYYHFFNLFFPWIG